MQALDKSSRESLKNTAVNYHNQLTTNAAAVAYWEGRGITTETAERFGLGFVGDPEPEDEPFTGRLVIPYMNYSPVHGWSCTGFKFRNFTGDKPKYLYRAGLTPELYNPEALLRDTDFVCIAEGEIDAISAEQAGLPCVGIPGSTHWEEWYPRLLKGYKAVYLLQDNDEAGEKMAAKWAKQVRNLKVLVMPDGDVNGTLVARGESYLQELIFLTNS